MRPEAIVDVEAPVLDIFLSRQGEGVCVGDPQIFIRFGGCNVVCDYCDTPDSIPAKAGRMQRLGDVLKQIDLLLPSREKVGMRDGVVVPAGRDHPSPRSSPLKGEEVYLLFTRAP